jgi:hypothetical protein
VYVYILFYYCKFNALKADINCNQWGTSGISLYPIFVLAVQLKFMYFHYNETLLSSFKQYITKKSCTENYNFTLSLTITY